MGQTSQLLSSMLSFFTGFHLLMGGKTAYTNTKFLKLEALETREMIFNMGNFFEVFADNLVCNCSVFTRGLIYGSKIIREILKDSNHAISLSMRRHNEN